MIGLDTNILIRYLTDDDPIQSPKAAEIFDRLTVANPGFVSIVAMVEVAWVLERSYDLNRVMLAEAIERMLQADSLAIECEQEVLTAMVLLKDGRGTFADALIGALGLRAGCRHTVTFDRQAQRLPGFVPA
jgi:predicted nucleic-acid-binding protein